MRCLLRVSPWMVGALLLASPVLAQDLSETAPAHLAVVDGAVTLDRDGDVQAAAPGMPIVPGDRLRSERGRAEVLFPDGTSLDVDEFTAIEFQSPEHLRFSEGRLLLMVAGAMNPSGARDFHIDTPVAGIDTFGPGEYRLALVNGRFGIEAELAVARGEAALTGDRGSLNLTAGQLSSVTSGGLPVYPQHFNTARFDAFERWAADRRDERRGSVSTQYLPPDLRMYSGALDRSGEWQYESSYGYVWYPAVAPDWRPYYDGYWSSVPHYGWTWIGGAAWSWPTHHYGRWGVTGGRWYWAPERRFAPAWVSWGAAPGYVSWCPLGVDNRPVVAASASFGTARGAVTGWVALPREHFGRHDAIARHATTAQQLPANTPFIRQASAPAVPPTASRRSAAGGVPASSDRVVPRVNPGPTGAADRRTSLRPSPAAPAPPLTGGATIVRRARPDGPAPAAAADVATGRAASPDRMFGTVRRYQPAPAADVNGNGGTIGSTADVRARIPGTTTTLPVYTPQTVDRATYGVRGRVAPRGAPAQSVPSTPSAPSTPGGIAAPSAYGGHAVRARGAAGATAPIFGATPAASAAAPSAAGGTPAPAAAAGAVQGQAPTRGRAR